MITHIKEMTLHKVVSVFMRPQTLFTILIYGAALFFAVFEGYMLVHSFRTSGRMTKIFVVLIPVFILMVALYQRMRIQTTVALLLLVFWIPLGIYAMELYLFEILIYVVSFLLIIKFPRMDDEKHVDGVMVKSFLSNFPWLPFFLYIVGALLTWSLSTKVGGEITIIRFECVFPLALSLVLFISIRSSEDAELFLWAILTSTAVLGVFFLVGRYIFPRYISLASYASGSGRLSMMMLMPKYLGYLEMLPQKTSNVFSFLLVYAYSLWIFHHSWLRRAYAFVLCLLFGCIIITTQGRGGAITAAIGAGVVSVYATFFRKSSGTSGVWIKFAGVCLAVIGGLWYLATHSTNIYLYQHGISLLLNPLQDENLLGRYQRLLDSIDLFMANPIFGIGLRGYETPWGLDTSEVLNIFLYTLLSFGLLGFIGFLMILFRFLIAFWHGIKSEDRITRTLCIASISGMTGFFLGLQSAGVYSMVIIWAPLVLAFAASRLNTNRPVMNPNFVDAM